KARQAKWQGLVAHAGPAGGTKPTKPWLTGATEQIEAIGRPECREILITCLGLLGSPARPVEGREVTRLDVHGQPAPTSVPVAGNADILKGLAWCCSPFDDPQVASVTGDAAQFSFKKISGIGPRAAKVGNACIYALGAMPGMHGIAQLQRLRQRVKQAPAIALIDTTLNVAAHRV